MMIWQTLQTHTLKLLLTLDIAPYIKQSLIDRSFMNLAIDAHMLCCFEIILNEGTMQHISILVY